MKNKRNLCIKFINVCLMMICLIASIVFEISVSATKVGDY